ncbi:type III polyketide synthase [Aestuariivirga litoralis]|uniref:type III polyketide synthase n=1 Tax=Aestuariivirga litoralis TaxID=2650924 RepID=UPI0018C50F1B|nr:type III polyketide synthase [Aestuariivirga litoralis]MBG1232275.1 type III polyketide synthase [Aestuariivirga litoralis]
MEKHAAKILSIATAVPPHVVETEFVRREAAKVFGRLGGSLFEHLLPIFGNSGIKRRYSVCPPEWFYEKQGWPERTAEYMRASKDLFKKAAHDALAQAGVAASEISTIVTVSTTGIATPSLEAHVMGELGFRTDVKRVPVFGLGCAGGLSGLSLAARLAVAEPGQKVLLVVIELCTLAFKLNEFTKANIVATAIFGDGAAAAVLEAGPGGLAAVEHAGEHTWPDSIDVMGWRVDPDGFGAIFSRDIPDLVTHELRPVADAFLTRHNLTLDDIDAFSFHPGGAKVITALEKAFHLDQGRLQDEREVLADYGNMSAATVMFVLARALKEKWKGRRLLGSLGPGFTASMMTMQPA